MIKSKIKKVAILDVEINELCYAPSGDGIVVNTDGSIYRSLDQTLWTQVI